MSDSSAAHILSANAGEVIKLTSPARLEVRILVDPARTGGAFSMGTMSLAPGSAIPPHRLVGQEELLFIHKGQGHATVEGRSLTVVPGMTVHVPRGASQSLRNTGTGFLQLTWTAAPAGLERFFRELAQAGAAADAASLQALAQRHGIELLPDEAARATPSSGGERHRRRRRGGRGRGRPQAHPSGAQAARPEVAPSPVSQPPGAEVQPKPARHRRRRRGGRGGRSLQGSAAPPPAAPSRPPQPPPSAQRSPRRARPRPRRGHVKEVYMGGKWVRVVGEGPVIATGRERPTSEAEEP